MSTDDTHVCMSTSGMTLFSGHGNVSPHRCTCKCSTTGCSTVHALSFNVGLGFWGGEVVGCAGCLTVLTTTFVVKSYDSSFLSGRPSRGTSRSRVGSLLSGSPATVRTCVAKCCGGVFSPRTRRDRSSFKLGTFRLTASLVKSSVTCVASRFFMCSCLLSGHTSDCHHAAAC